MSMSLAEALSQVELETGKTYRCSVKGQVVLVRVISSLPPSTPPVEIDEADLMMEDWTDLPLPAPQLPPVEAETYARIGLPEPYLTEDDALKKAAPPPAPDNA